MRKIKQIEVIRNGDNEAPVIFELFAVCDDGTLWHRRNSSDSALESDWEFVPGPEDGEPTSTGHELTLEEQAAKLNEHTGTFMSEKLKDE